MGHLRDAPAGGGLGRGPAAPRVGPTRPLGCRAVLGAAPPTPALRRTRRLAGPRFLTLALTPALTLTLTLALALTLALILALTLALTLTLTLAQTRRDRAPIRTHYAAAASAAGRSSEQSKVGRLYLPPQVRR